MINNEFWTEAAASWSWEEKTDIKIVSGNGGKISEEFLEKTGEVVSNEEFVSFDDIKYDVSLEFVATGGEIAIRNNSKENLETILNHVEDTGPKIIIDMDAFDNYFEMGTLVGFRNCFKLLEKCGLEETLIQKSKELENRIEVLEEAEAKFKKIYQADLSLFIENYIPESLNLVLGYIEYVNVKVSDNILASSLLEVEEVLNALLIGINDKIDEIYKFASIELKATAKALNATMSSNGYVDSKYKIN